MHEFQFDEETLRIIKNTPISGAMSAPRPIRNLRRSVKNIQKKYDLDANNFAYNECI